MNIPQRVNKLQVTKASIGILLIALFAIGTFSHCARVGMPQGGPKDSLPPTVVGMTPSFGKTKFKARQIYIEFDEYVQLKDQQKEFFVSPFMKKQPALSIRGRGVQIDLRDTLDPDQTYALNFGRSIVDNNESNPYVGLRYVFSTGDHVDSMVMSGYTIDGHKNDTVGNSYILFFDAADTLADGKDSTLFNHKILSVAKAFSNGIFLAENLKPMNYRIYALEDNNNNQQYEPGVDRVAFLDSVCNPMHMPPFKVWYDTTRFSLQADPQVLLRLFKEPPARRQVLNRSERPVSGKVNLYFAAPHPTIQELSFEGIDSSRLIREYLTENRDSISVWIDLSEPMELPDTLVGRLIYQRQDSVLNFYTDTVTLKLGNKPVPTRRGKDRKPGSEVASDKQSAKVAKRRAKVTAKRGNGADSTSEDATAEQDENATAEPNPFRVSVTPAGMVNPEQHITFVFSAPVSRIDTSAIELYHLESATKETPTPVVLTQDTVKSREWVLSAAWKPGSKYRLMIPAGALRTVDGLSNDTLKSEFSIESADKMGTLVLNIKNAESPQSEYIIQIEGKDGKVLQLRTHLTEGVHRFRYLPTEEVRIKVTDDRNKNGRWDTGSLVERRQPERVETFVDPNNREGILLKVNWELEFDLDMATMFAPATMEIMQEQIKRREEVRMKRLAEERIQRERDRKKQKSTPQPNQQQGGMNQGFPGQGQQQPGGMPGMGNQRY